MGLDLRCARSCFVFCALYFLLLPFAAAQEDDLAKHYFNDGDYDKAVVFYEKLVTQHPRRTDYAEALVHCYQQLEHYQDAEDFLLKKSRQPYASPTLYIELGYNYTLQGQSQKATPYYDKALWSLDKNPNFGYSIGYRFQHYALLDYALRAYTRAMTMNPSLNYNFQLAQIYGEQGRIEKMYQAYLNLITQKNASRSYVLPRMEAFITTDPAYPNNVLLRKLLLKNAQENPDILWNELLSWLFIQQKQYKKAFHQEKAIYKRAGIPSLDRLEHLGQIALQDKDYENATTIFTYIVAHSTDATTQLDAQLNLINISLKKATASQWGALDKKFQHLITTYGTQSDTGRLHIAYAHFLAFTRETPAPAIALLKAYLKRPLDPIAQAQITLALGDILVYDQKFNQALLYFTRVQKSLKNDVLGQEARFKVAQTSFYKGDFDWALTQLQVLRGSTSQLIANDAMQLSLLIADNIRKDTTSIALQQYAQADLFAYQNKTQEALTLLEGLLQNHKGEAIEDEALLRQAQLLEARQRYTKAAFNYKKIVAFYADGILADDAHFALGELYRTALDQPEKAKSHYETILYTHPDSYYAPQARKYFRQLRGDAVD